LPGPVHAIPAAIYDLNSNRELMWFLGESLGYGKPSTNRALAPALVCPAYSAHIGKLRDGRPLSTYTLNENIGTASGACVAPFGNPAEPISAPLKVGSISAHGSPAGVFAMRDADKGNVNPQAARWADLPYRPAHGRSRNQLAFDWHVEEKSW
jgi:hypothetical protein